MANEPITLQLGQYMLAAVAWKDNMGNPMEPLEGALTTWTSDRTVVLTCENSMENPGMASCRAIKIGDAVLTGTAPFDTGFGVQNAITTLSVSVVEVVTPNGEIMVSYGSILPLSIDGPKPQD